MTPNEETNTATGRGIVHGRAPAIASQWRPSLLWGFLSDESDNGNHGTWSTLYVGISYERQGDGPTSETICDGWWSTKGTWPKKGKSLMPLEPATSRIDSYQAKNCQYRVVGFPGGRCLLGAEAFGPMKCAARSEMAASGVQLNRSAIDVPSGQWTADSS